MKTKINNSKGFTVKQPTHAAEWVFIMPDNQSCNNQQNIIMRLMSRVMFRSEIK
ncbi:hypothetical protein KJ782_04110 [Patescibacteria group bacterium]|nr:hypothetical protein [Patescibacteria group bacterium]